MCAFGGVCMRARVRVCGGRRKMPTFGLGVFRSEPGGETHEACEIALAHGYVMIDTAQVSSLSSVP